jgi:CubicO group peptidase (beta-lactamase class C family)
LTPNFTAKISLRLFVFAVFQMFLFQAFTLPYLVCQSISTREIDPKRSKLNERIPVWLKAFNVTGVSIAEINNGEISWTAFYGDQFLGGPKANADTLYDVASLTKPITAEVILRMASVGQLSLDEPISPYWVDPDVEADPRHNLLTPRLCLSHETGFPNWRYQTKNTLRFVHDPGTEFGYSGEGFNYVAHFAEKKTGKNFEELAQSYVFGPIGLKDTSYTPRPWWKDRQAKPVEQGDRIKWSAAALLRTTVHDYAEFIISVMNNQGITPEIAAERVTIKRNLTSPEMSSALCESAKLPQQCSVATGFSLGWRVVRIGNTTILDHTGADSDVKTFAFFIPSEKRGAVIFTDGPDVGHRMIDRILEVIYPNSVYAETLWPDN